VTPECTGAEVEACARRLTEESPRTSGGFHASLMPVWKGDSGVGSVLLAPLWILMAICFVLFLIVGANINNLQLVRATTRRAAQGSPILPLPKPRHNCCFAHPAYAGLYGVPAISRNRTDCRA
jgi:hypothetical protein